MFYEKISRTEVAAIKTIQARSKIVGCGERDTLRAFQVTAFTNVS